VERQTDSYVGYVGKQKKDAARQFFSFWKVSVARAFSEFSVARAVGQRTPLGWATHPRPQQKKGRP